MKPKERRRSVSPSDQQVSRDAVDEYQDMCRGVPQALLARRVRSACGSSSRGHQGRSATFHSALDQAERMLIAVPIDAKGGDQHQVLANVQAVELDDQQVELGQVRRHPRARRSADSATNRREAADFEVPSPAIVGRSPSGTARLSLRVDTLINIRFIAQRPSQSSACAAVQVGSAASRPSKLRTRGRCTVTLPPWKPILCAPSGSRHGLRRGGAVRR
jgi:hypothetical protein